MAINQMKIDSTIAKAAKSYVRDYLVSHLDENFQFHNLEHTETVVKAVNAICQETGIDEHGRRILQVAAWFHDVGYTERMENHEDVGARLAEKFLAEHLVDQNDIEMVKNCIIATHYPQHPLNTIEEILCDADMFHLAEKKYIGRSQLLRNEWAATRGKEFSDLDWVRVNIAFLDKHSYHTEFCRVNLEKEKQKNIKKLRALELELASREPKENVLIPEHKKAKPARQPEYGRGVETLFRIASGNHMQLSGMADNKAHILLSINSIIISVVLSVIAKKLDEGSYLIYPTLLLLLVCLISIVFAVLTTRPKLSKKHEALTAVNSRDTNLLFFGKFHHLEEEAYQSGVRELMVDRNFLYQTLTRDIYYLGKVLAVKYRYLNIGYMVFMYGLILSVCAFGVSFFYN
jgi:predicted metal-dependent HD superfamily phosphohydrolase